MTFTYDLAGGSDVSLVRFHIGDVESSAAMFSDEEIAAILDLNAGSVSETVIACLVSVIGRLSQPNFTADWLTVDLASARNGFRALLAMKRAEFGIGARAMKRPFIRSDRGE